MTKKEHLLSVRPKIEYDTSTGVLNDVLTAMENHSDEQVMLVKNNIGLGDVRQQRELLIAFYDKIKPVIIALSEKTTESVVDYYIKKSNL